MALADYREDEKHARMLMQSPRLGQGMTDSGRHHVGRVAVIGVGDIWDGSKWVRPQPKPSLWSRLARLLRF